MTPPGPAAPLRRFLPTWVALLVATIVVDLAMVAAYVHLAAGDTGRPLAPSFPLSYKNWLMWAAFSPAIIAVTHAMIAGRWPWARRLAASIALAAGLALAHAGVEIELHRWAGTLHANGHVGSFFSYHLFHGLLTFCVLYAVALLAESERAARQRERREAQLQEQVTRAQLHTLRMQLQPHFLFNTLNSASALVEDDVRAGQRMLARLSDFLRLTLRTAEHQEVPLRDELRLVDAYVGIERIRFGDRLRVEYDVAEEAEQALVPNLILQPIVENAIRHGVQPSLGGGTVTVRAKREGGSLVLEVTDDGVGLDQGGTTPRRSGPSGVGLANTTERLRHCYGSAASLDLLPCTPSGTTVVQRLPFVTA